MSSGPTSPDPGGPVLICFDGSKEAEEAILYAGGILAGRPALVVSVWKAIIEEALSTAMTPPVADPVDANLRERDASEQVAADGARLAEQAGLRAKPLVVVADDAVWEAVELAAEEHKAEMIVCGTRRSGVKAALPGNLASALVNHASRPVLVVPSAQTAARRAREVQEERSSRHAAVKAVSGAAAAAKRFTAGTRTSSSGTTRRA